MVGNPLYFFDQLGDETLFRVIPNQGHGGVAGGRNTKLKRNQLPFQNNRKWSPPKYRKQPFQVNCFRDEFPHRNLDIFYYRLIRQESVRRRIRFL